MRLQTKRKADFMLRNEKMAQPTNKFGPNPTIAALQAHEETTRRRRWRDGLGRVLGVRSHRPQLCSAPPHSGRTLMMPRRRFGDVSMFTSPQNNHRVVYKKGRALIPTHTTHQELLSTLYFYFFLSCVLSKAKLSWRA